MCKPSLMSRIVKWKGDSSGSVLCPVCTITISVILFLVNCMGEGRGRDGDGEGKGRKGGPIRVYFYMGNSCCNTDKNVYRLASLTLFNSVIPCFSLVSIYFFAIPR